MRPSDLIRTVALNLRRMRWRLVLTIGGVVIGTASVVLMIAIGAGMERSLTSELDSMGSATQLTVYKSGENPFQPIKTSGGLATRLDERAVEQIREIEGVAVAAGMHQLQATATYKGYSTGVTVMTVDPRTMEKLGLEVAEGRGLKSGSEIVVGNLVPVMMLGEEFSDPDSARRLDLLGKRLALEVESMLDGTGMDGGGDMESAGSEEPAAPKRVRLRVSGVLDSVDFDKDMAVFVPETVARSVLGLRGRRLEYPQVVVRVADVDDIDRVTDAIQKLGLEPMSMREQVEAARQAFAIIQLVLGGIGAVALAVASLGIANTMTMSTYERTREIGIMKAIGASPRQIRRVFLGESGAIGLGGGAIGLALSASIAALANLALARQLDGQALFYIAPWLAIFSVAFATVIGVLAGVLPAARAANLDPLVALRHE